MEKAISGGCACGAVRYAAKTDPVMMLNCHCRDCQRASGSGFAPVVVFAHGAIEFTGELIFRSRTGDNGSAVERGSCPIRGDPVANKLERLPDIIGILASSLDDPSLHQPSIDMFADSAQPWDHLAPTTRKLARGMPA